MALGLGVVFFGYWVGLFGFASLRGPGVGFVDLIVPGRTPPWPAGGSSGGGNTPASTTPAGIAALHNASCKTIKAIPATDIAAILKTDPTFAIKLAQCGLPGPLTYGGKTTGQTPSGGFT